MNVCIYRGKGVSERSVEALMALFPYGKKVSAKEVISGTWRETASLFIMPGGRDIPYDRALRGAGNRQIKKFVEGGGCYLGICAGAYYGAAKVEFEIGTEMEVDEERELGLYPGRAIGTLYPGFDYEGEAGAHIVQVGDSHYYYNGGCGFPEADELLGVTVKGRYSDSNIPAIVSCSLGKGIAILSGVHLEFGFFSRDTKMEQQVCEKNDSLISTTNQAILDLLPVMLREAFAVCR
jgi:glutamine amidotransferase-like uncharacterized protein